MHQIDCTLIYCKFQQQIALHAIVATHSPQIVSSHLDIQIDLGELYGEELDTEQSN